jgi:hypothetical protein
MLNVAGASGKLAAVKWLREHGAEWPPILRYTTVEHPRGRRFNMWSGATIAWAVEQGAGMRYNIVFIMYTILILQSWLS